MAQQITPFFSMDDYQRAQQSPSMASQIGSGLKSFLLGGDAGNSIDPNKARYADRDYLSEILRGNIGSVGGRQAPMSTAAQIGRASQLAGGPQNQWRGMQMDTAGRLAQIASGQAKGAGELAVDRQLAQAQAAQQAGVRMARGGNAALAARAAARNMAGLGVAGAGQAQQAALGDQMGADSMLAGIMQAGRGADLDFASQNAQLQQQRNLAQAGFNQQTGLANQAAQLQQTGLNDQAQINYLGQLLGMNSDEMRAFMQAQQARAMANAADTGFLGDFMQMAGGLGQSYIMRPQGQPQG